MAIPAGTRLGPYEILSPLGAGGMGEVYKAKDGRLDRFVAIKVLPEHLAKHPESLARFEREAKAVAALNHTNITGLFDIGREGETVYAVMELLEGQTLRAKLQEGPLPPRAATELAVQMAQGLAAAHEKGVIHRDLKPENLWITRDGHLKILDFGLAKQLTPLGPSSNSFLPTEAMSPGHHTEQGMILGTMGYMSPEQVRGEAVDARADLFSFGAVLFEMLTGKRAFGRDTAADTMSAILKEDPFEGDTSSRPLPPALRMIVDHCLEKVPARRFRDAHDLAFALTSSANPSSDSGTRPGSKSPSTSAFTPLRMGVGALLVAACAGAWWLGRGGSTQPTFKRLTFGKGTIDGARFTPGSMDIVFSARWNGEAPEVFSLNPVALEPRSLGVKGGTLMSISPTGELALRMNPRLWAGFEIGQLARVTPGGGMRLVQEGAFDTDWMPDGSQLAVVVSGDVTAQPTPGKAPRMTTLQFPVGHPVANEVPFTWSIRVSPKGDRLACFEQPTFDQGDGRIVVVDLKGQRTPLAEVRGFTGLAWGPEGDEIWFSEFRDGGSSLQALSLSGRKRLLMRQAGLLELLDVRQDGRVLAALGFVVKGTMGMSAPDFREKDLSWNEATFAQDISPDGKRLLIGKGGGWSSQSERLSLYLRTTDGAPPTPLGEAGSARFMPDGKQIMTLNTSEEGAKVSVVPLGPGATKELRVPGRFTQTVEPLPDGQHALISEVAGNRWLVVDLSTGQPDQVERMGMSSTANARAVSPDGAWLLLRRNGANLLDAPHFLISTRGAPERPVKGIENGEVPMRWNADGTAIYVFNRDGFPTRIVRVDLATGKRTLVREITPANPGGLPGIRSFAMTPDAQHLAYNYVRKLSDLYLIEGLK